MRILQARSIRRSSQVIAVSDYTKDEIVSRFGVPKSKVTVIYNGTAPVCENTPEPIVGISQPFFLFVGSIKPRKNVLAIIRAYSIYVRNTETSASLVLVGNMRGAYGERVRQLISGLGLNERVQTVGFASEGQLSWLYTHALAFVFPSLLEGFGMAALDAMRYGVPTIASGTTGLGEVVADAAIRVDPTSPEEIATALTRIAEDEALRQELRERGIARAREFSWEKAARETLALLVDLPQP